VDAGGRAHLLGDLHHVAPQALQEGDVGAEFAFGSPFALSAEDEAEAVGDDSIADFFAGDRARPGRRFFG
jgi:hypothetical protein